MVHNRQLHLLSQARYTTDSCTFCDMQLMQGTQQKAVPLSHVRYTTDSCIFFHMQGTKQTAASFSPARFTTYAWEPEVGKMTTFDLWPRPWGVGGMGCRDKKVTSWPKLAMNRFLPLLATQNPTLWIHTSGGGSTGYYVSPPIDQYLKFKNHCSLPCTGAAVQTTHFIGWLSVAFMCTKAFSVYFIST